MIPDVSVVIPTFNRWPMVSEAVASALAQRDVRVELIIVDDGSTDDSLARLSRAFGKETTPIYLLHSNNRGPAAARNAGVAVAQAPLIAFLDSDDLWAPDKLKRQIERMKQSPGCVVSQTGEIWMRNGSRVNPGLRHNKRRGDFFLAALRTCLVSPSAVIVNSRVFRELGGFDEDMRAAEDYDLWLRFLLDYQIELIPEPMVTRRAGHPGQLSTMPAIDRFRILGLLKLLLRNGLGAERRDAVCEVLIEKCDIYANGAARRDRLEEACFARHLSHSARGPWRTASDCSLTAAIADWRSSLRSGRCPAQS